MLASINNAMHVCWLLVHVYVCKFKSLKVAGVHEYLCFYFSSFLYYCTIQIKATGFSLVAIISAEIVQK